MTTTLLDTNALIWSLGFEENLGRNARRLFNDATRSAALLVSAISFWEVGLLYERRRIVLDTLPQQWRREVLAMGVDEVPVSGDIGISANQLAGFHADPADRIIVATALKLDATLITSDRKILEWQGPLRTIDARR